MTVELEAFAGHLLVVGGRAVRIPPPGALAESAPRRVARAREGDRFFILVTPAGSLTAQAAFYEELARLAADVYFGSSGGVTGGLREALSAIHQELFDQQDEVHAVSALALALHGAELFAARGGRMFGLLRQEDDLAFFPGTHRDPIELNLPPLGIGQIPDIQLAHFEVVPGDTMLIADSGLLPASDEALSEALSAASVPEVIDRLKPLAGQQVFASVIRFVEPGTPDPSGLTVEPGTHAPRRVPSRPAPVAVPAIDLAAAEPATAFEDASVAPALSPLAAAEPAGAIRADSFAPGGAPVPVDSSPAGTAAFSPGTLFDDTGAASALDEIEDWASAPSRLRGLFGRTPPEPSEEGVTTSGGPSPLTVARLRVERAGRDALRAILLGALAVINGFSTALDRILPAPDAAGRQGIPTNVAVGLAVLIPVVIVVVALGMVLSGYEKSDFDTYMERARNAHAEAIKLSNGTCDNQALRPLWSEVLHLSEQAAQLRPNDTNVLLMRADAQNYLDCFDDVVRRDVTLLHEFPKDADLVGPIVHGGVDLYTLDRTRGAIYHDTLNEIGNALTTSDRDPIIWRGQTISGSTGNFVIGDLLDLEWLSNGGTPHDNVLIALDRNGVLVSYSPTFFATAQQLVTENRWVNPIAIAIFRQNLYVLDPGANQIWRYVPPAGVGAYSNAPEEYFNGTELPDLSAAVDFGISDQGAIFVLFADGSVQNYRRDVQGIAETQPFNFRQRPPGAITSGVALFVDNDPASTSLFVVDRDNETIYETSWGGTFNQGYRPRNLPDAFRDLKGFYADAVVRNNVYVLASNKLYHFLRNQ